MINDKYGLEFTRVAAGAGIRLLHTPIAAPKANAFCERLLGSVRRECLDHLIILNSAHLRRVLAAYFRYYHCRTHLGLKKDAPDYRAPSDVSAGRIVALPEVGGLHHRYERRAA